MAEKGEKEPQYAGHYSQLVIGHKKKREMEALENVKESMTLSFNYVAIIDGVRFTQRRMSRVGNGEEAIKVVTKVITGQEERQGVETWKDARGWRWMREDKIVMLSLVAFVHKGEGKDGDEMKAVVIDAEGKLRVTDIKTRIF